MILRPAENLKQENEPAKTAEAELMPPELQKKMSEQMAAIRQTLDGQPELAERLLTHYTRFVESAQQRVKKAAQIYDEIFFEKKRWRWRF